MKDRRIGVIVVRDVFQLKFGRAKEAVEVWKEGMTLARELGYGAKDRRLMTDVVGESYYTLVLESTYDSLAEFEQAMQNTMGKERWKTWYQKFTPLVESGKREVLKVVDM